MNESVSEKRILSYVCIWALIFVAYGIYVPFHYSSDGWYEYYSYGLIDGAESGLFAVWPKAVAVGFSGGRYIKGIVLFLAGLLSKTQWLMSPVVSAMGVCVLAVAGCTAWSGITEHRKEGAILPFLCLCVAFCQPFFTDWFQFSECQLVYPLGVFCAIFSAKTAFSTKKGSAINKWCFACLWLLIAAGIYQITMQWFVLMSMVIVVINITDGKEENANQLTRHLVFQILFALSIYAVAAAVQLLFTHVLFNSARAASSQTLQGRMWALLQAQKNLWKMVPYSGNKGSLLFPVVCILSFWASTVSVMKAHRSRGVKATQIAAICICTLGFYASIFLPIFFTESWYPQRSVVGFWGIPLLLSLASKEERKRNGNLSIVRMVSVLASSVMIVINLYSCLLFGSDLYRVNAMDTMRAQLIEEQIETYEAESGQQIRYLAFHYDSAPLYCYNGIVNSHENNLSAWSASWNPLAIMNLSSGRGYAQRDYSDELYCEQYADQNWDLFSPEQVFFHEETAYIAIY